MSLTTVAAAIRPDESLSKLPPSRPERFQASDFIAAGLVFFITLGVYIATLAPNVTLEDSGELITAATKFGVGHPPGYPLWTMSGFLLSHILPFGGLAWRINLLCALFGATSNAVLTLLTCHSGRWLLQRWTDPEHQPAVRRYVFYAGMLVGLVIGFSDVMWSQAVISAVHGTLNALFVNLVLLFFYLWMLEPKKTHRLVLAVFIFSLGLTNHHTLVQIIPAFLLAAFIVRAGKFWSVFLAVNLFSLSILVYISWLSGDEQLHRITEAMAKLILGTTVAVSFFYAKEFRLRLFLTGSLTAFAIFAYGQYLLDPGEKGTLRFTAASAPHWWLVGSFAHPGWLQLTSGFGLFMLAAAALSMGLLYTSTLDRRLIIGVFVVGWIGLVPYSYEPFASSTHPPMNWGYPKLRSGFYYAVSREQYPKSLPTLIKMTFGKVIGVVPKDYNPDATIGMPHYYDRLWKTFYYYGDNLQLNFTVPLIFLTLAIFFYAKRCDRPQVNWFIFLGASFFLLGFMLLIIAPQEAFDFERNLQYKVFHLQSHCIFVLLMGYGALALMTYLHELMPEIPARTGVIGFGMPALFLALLPLWSNFEGCDQAGHWFGYDYGADMMRNMDKNAVYWGGSDPGRFVPTFMAFVESQQDNRWKREPNFDRRDVTVITQNALCDTYYANYIRDQYDPRFRPTQWTPFERWLGRDQAYPKEPITCVNDDELMACWEEYEQRPDVIARMESGGPLTREGSNDVFDINGIVAQKIFEKNKKNHTFYIEQSSPIQWMYPYLLPSGLIFKLNPDPLTDVDFLARGVVAEDHKFWDAYSKKLLSDPKFSIDAHASLTFGKLAFWHADLYRYRHLEKEQEYWLKMALALCPQLPDAVLSLSHLLSDQTRYDEAVAVIQQAQLADPRNDNYGPVLDSLIKMRIYGKREIELRAKLAQAPSDIQLNLEFARLLQDEGRLTELNDRMRVVAGLNNWSHEAMAGIIQYYITEAHNPDAAIAFLEARAKIDPKASELIYTLAALHASLGHKDQAFQYLSQALASGGTNALISAKIDPRFATLSDDPRFQALMGAPPTNLPATHPPQGPLPKPVNK